MRILCSAVFVYLFNNIYDSCLPVCSHLSVCSFCLSVSVSLSVCDACMCVSGQFVLFVGVTILLASTYVTMTTQEKLVQQESVVKRALPIDQHLDADRPDLPAKQLPRGVCYCMQLLAIVGCIQCFDTVGWASVSIFFGS